jgi:DNA primase catalytic core
MSTDRGRGGRPGRPGVSVTDQDRAACTRLTMLAAAFFRDQLPGSWVPEYLQTRGLSPVVQARWHAGYAPAAWDALTCHLRALGCPDALIEEARLGCRSRRGTLIDIFRDRAIFPVRSPDGTVAGFIGRASECAAACTPKYINSPRNRLYDKSALLFGLWEARRVLSLSGRPVIVEGPLDAVAVTTAGEGHLAGVAPCGTALTLRQLTALSDLADLRGVGAVVAFDADPAGRRAAVRAYPLLCQFTDKVDAVTFQPGQDPAQVLASEGLAALASMLNTYTRPLADLVIDSEFDRWDNWLRFAEGQVNALRATAELIAAMPPSHVGRQVSRVAIRLGMGHEPVTDAVMDALSRAVHGTPRT